MGIHERIAKLLERQAYPMENDVRAAVERQAERELRIALDERGIVLQGDWCAATNAAATASCADAFRMNGTFAASSVKISGNCP